MRTAHIVTANHEVGDRVLALCGKEHKVKQLWGDIPDEAPICRGCTDTAIAALDQADEVITLARRWLVRVDHTARSLAEVLNPDDDLMVDMIADASTLFEMQQVTRKRAKEERKKAQRTCTCEWTDTETFTEDPDCPIHGKTEEPELPPVAPPQE